MVAIGNNHRSGPELRRKPRQPFHYNAAVLTEDNQLHRCAIADVSETGARIQLETDWELPERFLLLLTRGGGTRRLCRKVWRDGLMVGVEFPVPHG
jgi:PilZ domain